MQRKVRRLCAAGGYYFGDFEDVETDLNSLGDEDDSEIYFNITSQQIVKEIEENNKTKKQLFKP